MLLVSINLCGHLSPGVKQKDKIVFHINLPTSLNI